MFDEKPGLVWSAVAGQLAFCAVMTLLFITSAHAQAVTVCPNPIPPAIVCVTWKAPLLRDDAPINTPLPLSEIGSYQLLRNGVSINKSVPAADTAYLYTVPQSQCTNVGDVWTMTTTDTDSNVSKVSLPWTQKVQVCGPKARPNPPIPVTNSQGG